MVPILTTDSSAVSEGCSYIRVHLDGQVFLVDNLGVASDNPFFHPFCKRRAHHSIYDIGEKLLGQLHDLLRYGKIVQALAMLGHEA